MPAIKLSPRRRKFALEYIKNGFNGTQAVFAAGYNMGYNSARVEACRLLANPSIRRIVDNHINKSQISADEILQELSDMARAPVEKVSEQGKLKALELSGKAKKLFVDKVETNDITEQSSLKATLLASITHKANKTGGSAEQIEREMQLECADKESPTYQSNFDPTVCPENWPHPELLGKPEIAPIEGGEQ